MKSPLRLTQRVAGMGKGHAKKWIVGLVLGAAAFNAQADLYEDGLMAYAVGNFSKAGELFMAAADAGNDGAEHMLMRLFSENKLYAHDLAGETLKWTRKAAEKGVMQAQVALANIYAEQQGDIKAAVAWYRKAAKQGHPEAYYKLGKILETGGQDVSANADESVRLFRIAASEYDVYAQQGSADAQYTLAGMYQQGLGVKKNIALALKWWEKSALQGHALAQLSLGQLYARGEGVERNTLQAKYWLNLAAAQGVQEAELLLAELKDDGSNNIALAM